MTKTQFKTEMVKRGFECLKFKNDMIFEKNNILFNIEYIGNKYTVFMFDNETMYNAYIPINNGYDLQSLIDVINNFCNEYDDL